MLGNTAFAKVCNSIVLVPLLGYPAVKVFSVLGIDFSAEIVTREVVRIESSHLLSTQKLQEKLSKFSIDQSHLSAVLSYLRCCQGRVFS